ncbi:NACHT domain-containing protein [Limnofasciculus baicalensis]|uniref:NACHT domain-containing NTPase n=1 Tax=Limnofasciculus baicalensis BBK-W-15 TaxID=2699891 RepID=A0AAE3GWW0_9CYAN|nr:NACHT domain-containing NTPase [Limnofasciculus baicalensis]MCP2731964.1 NACHT domain-containing NTPase [Limnofasciculus baicalensis BBK-W-15]
MIARSFYASATGIIKAREAMAHKRLTQELLATGVGLKTRQSVGRFLAGKPVDRRVFIEICCQLDLDWQEIAVERKLSTPTTMRHNQENPVDIDALVQEARSLYHDKIDAQCSTLQLLELPQPIDLAHIYIDAYILEDIPNRRWLEITDLQKSIPLDSDRDTLAPFHSDHIAQERVLAIEAATKYFKLMILGKPGTGKSTFLKFIALQCNRGTFQPHLLPIYIELKDFVEDAKEQSAFSLENYISQELDLYDILAENFQALLRHGKLLILLDGLDEVPDAEKDRVITEIRRLSQRYYKNQFIITCRLAAHQYRFQGFTEVEIADFTNHQITNFAQKYFVATSSNNQGAGLTKASQFIEQLKYPDNRKIRELAATPLLLNLICSVFQSKASFPTQHAKLYEEGLEILLVKWDRSKGVRRDETYYNLSLVNKIKLLNQLGAKTFEQEDYLFAQNKVQQHIIDYLRQLPDPKSDPVALQIDSEAVLKSIERQHGLLVERARRIYSFSHLTFQEYFTARHITTTNDLVNDSNQALEQLVTHITRKRWREIFLLAAGMLRRVDDLIWLMKEEINQLLIPDDKLLQFLGWIDRKSQSVSVKYKPVAVRAFYFSLTLTLNEYLKIALNPDSGNNPFSHKSELPLSRCLSLALALDPNFDLHRDIGFNFNSKFADIYPIPALNRFSLIEQTINCIIHFDLALIPSRIKELQESIQKLKIQIHQPEKEPEQIHIWWSENQQTWTEKLIAILHEHYHIGHIWDFSTEQTRSLWQYYEANQLLVDCLNSSYELNPEVRSLLEEKLLKV